MRAGPDPIASALTVQPLLILDGGLGSELGFRGQDLSDPLWSARLLLDAPAAIREVHTDYLEAGADVLTTASYQVSYEGFGARGLSRREVDGLLGRSVDLAREARDAWWEAPREDPGDLRAVGAVSTPGASSDGSSRLRPLVAASVGPYGASLGDGSEYVGRYGLSVQALARWHRPRLEALALAGADLMACETLPCLEEAEALLGLLREEPHLWAWMSFSCRDGARLSQGEPFVEAVALCAASPQVVAVGLNCVKPRYVASLLGAARGVAEAAGKPLLAYPNSAEEWDAAARAFVSAGSPPPDFAALGPVWRDAGARLLGGCCRIRPQDIRRLRARLLGPVSTAIAAGSTSHGAEGTEESP